MSRIKKNLLRGAAIGLATVATLIAFKPFQVPVFWSQEKTLVLHWSRQIGKSFVLAAWSVYRCVTKAVEGKPWVVTVLSNSKDNGTEFMSKVAHICNLLRIAFEQVDLSPDDLIENMRVVCRIKIAGVEARIMVLAANPRTARGFSGDLILDEFAWHENSLAIWDAAEPIISGNAEYQCRIASTGNGRWNMFYQICGGCSWDATTGNPAGIGRAPSGFLVSRVSRTAAHRMGQAVHDPKTGEAVTPDEARQRALDKASYDQNYELAFNDEEGALLTHEMISGAEYAIEGECAICEGAWTEGALDFLRRCVGPLMFGMDVGRTRNMSSIAVGERIGGLILTRGLLRMHNTRLPRQKEQLGMVCRLPNFSRSKIDSTGIGLGLVEFAQEQFGYMRVEGVNFASREVRDTVQDEIRQRDPAAKARVKARDTALVTELMAVNLQSHFEDRTIRIPCEAALRDSLRKPQRIVTATGVRIAAEDDDSGHADEFWALALMAECFRAPMGAIGSTKGIRLGKSDLGGRRQLKRKTLRRGPSMQFAGVLVP